MTNNILYITIVLLFATCNGRTSAQNVSKSDIHIPRYREGPHKGDTTYLYQAVKRNISALNLDYLEGGFDSLQLRIWLGHSMAIKKNVIVLKYHNDRWYGQLITFTLGHDPMTMQEFVATKEDKVVVPKSGWGKFIKQILDLRLLALPDEVDLYGYSGCGFDGLPYYFEIAMPNKYRFYSYCNIEDNVGRFEEARDIEKIANLLEMEFGFTYTK